MNNEKLELGISPEGDVIDDVLLPNWADVHRINFAYNVEWTSFLNYKLECARLHLENEIMHRVWVRELEH